MPEESISTSQKSPIFDRIIGDDVHDVERLVAYALYKDHKRAWCAAFEAENGRAPTDVEKMSFAKGVAVQSQLDRYLKDAQDALGEYAGYLIDGERPVIREEAITGRIETAAAKIEASGKFWNVVANTVVSSVLTTIVLIVIAIGIELAGIDLIDAIGSIHSSNATESFPTE